MRGALVFALVAASCSSPRYGNGHLQCAASTPACPAGFYCASDSHCWLQDSGPPTGGDLSAPSDLAGVILDLAGGGGDLGTAASKCGASSALLCEGFESPLLLNGWGQSAHNGTVTIDNTRAFRGKSSLRSSIQASAANTSPYAGVSEQKTFPITGLLYARVWVYFSPALPSSFEQFLNFTDAGSTGLSIATDAGRVTLDDYAGALYQPSTTLLPLDRWVCVQFSMSQGTATGTFDATVDGQHINDFPTTGPTPTAVKLILGVDFNANNVAIPAYDAWFDELVVDNKPISCAD